MTQNYLFDVKLFVSLRLDAESEAEARKKLDAALADGPTVTVCCEDGEVITGEGSPDGELALIEVDGEDPATEAAQPDPATTRVTVAPATPLILKTYRGHYTPNGVGTVKVHISTVGEAILIGPTCYALPPRNDLYNHSPDGFAWGYGGSGPAQLALALLADALGDDKRAERLHQDFKCRFVAWLDQNAPWETTDRAIIRLAEEAEAALARSQP